MHAPAGPALLAWLESTAFAAAMRQWLWLYPIVEIAHITGIALLVGSIAMFDLRVLGLSRTLPVRALARHLLPWTWAGFAIVAATGAMMFTTHATEFWSNPAFAVKLALIGLAGANALWFHVGVYGGAQRWDTDTAAPVPAKAAAALSLALWLGVISCGRLLAYL
ncbi:MAG: hypothetical protein N3D71_13075 [Burkholderiaceae bacterium]|nr:hypothetical protein [Burkholderiaceae bacterium]